MITCRLRTTKILCSICCTAGVSQIVLPSCTGLSTDHRPLPESNRQDDVLHPSFHGEYGGYQHIVILVRLSFRPSPICIVPYIGQVLDRLATDVFFIFFPFVFAKLPKFPRNHILTHSPFFREQARFTTNSSALESTPCSGP